MLYGLHQVNPLPKLSLIYTLKWQPQTKGKRGTLPTQSLFLHMPNSLCAPRLLWGRASYPSSTLEVLLYRPAAREGGAAHWMPGSYKEEFSEWWHLLLTQQAWPELSLAPSHWWLLQAGRAVLEAPLVPAPPAQHWQVSAERLSLSPRAVTEVLLTSLWDPRLDPGQCAAY